MLTRAALATRMLLLASFYSLRSGAATCNTNLSEPMTWVDLQGVFYGLSNNDVVDMVEARCVCAEHQGTRLALEDGVFQLDAVQAHLSQNHLSKKFWVDAARSSDAGVYKWGNGCALSSDNRLWTGGEGDVGGALTGAHCAVLRNVTGDVMSLSPATCSTASARALCQTARPPDIFSHTPMDFTWVQLGSPALQFAFSNTKMYFNSSKQACTALPGAMELACLHTHFDDVAQYLSLYFPERQYWVDAGRASKQEPFRWGNGVPVNASFWAPQEPGSNDLLARLRLKDSDARLAGMSGQDKDYYVVCRGAPGETDVTLEWTSLGSPKQHFGFSNASLDFLSAKRACAQQAGNVSLARLQGNFDEVQQYLHMNHPEAEYWVDATRSGSTFVWGDGQQVVSLTWADNEPQPGDDAVMLTADKGLFKMAGQVNTSSCFFICQGSPGVETDPASTIPFPAGCSESEEAMTSLMMQEMTHTSHVTASAISTSSDRLVASRLLDYVTWNPTPSMNSPLRPGTSSPLSSVSNTIPKVQDIFTSFTIRGGDCLSAGSVTFSPLKYSATSTANTPKVFSKFPAVADGVVAQLASGGSADNREVGSPNADDVFNSVFSDPGANGKTSYQQGYEPTSTSFHRLGSKFVPQSDDPPSSVKSTLDASSVSAENVLSPSISVKNTFGGISSGNVQEHFYDGSFSSASVTNKSQSRLTSAAALNLPQPPCCRCVSAAQLRDPANDKLEDKMASIRKELLVDVHNLSASVRLLRSAPDWRPSAVVSGVVAIMTLTFLAATIMIPDLHLLGRALMEARRRRGV